MGGCGETGPVTPTPTASISSSATTPAPTPTATPTPRSTPVGLSLDLATLAPLYRRFFSEGELTTALAADLGAIPVSADIVTVKVEWVEAINNGRITVLVPDGEPSLAAAAVAPGLDTTPLEPWLAAIARYRQSAGERFDLRIESFELALEVWDPVSAGRCTLPAERREVAFRPCVRCSALREGDQELCGPELSGGTPEARQMLLRALRRR